MSPGVGAAPIDSRPEGFPALVRGSHAHSMTTVECEHVPCGRTADRVFARLAGRAGSCFLDSASDIGGLGRYSFIGFDPFLVIRTDGEGTTVTEDGVWRREPGEPLEVLRAQLRRFSTEPVDGVPFPGGAVGGLAYEFGSRLERIPRPDGSMEGIPEMQWSFYDGVIMFERGVPGAWCVANPVHRASGRRILARLRDALEEGAENMEEEGDGSLEAGAVSNFDRAEYEAAVRSVKARIAAGEVYQVNLSQRFELPMRGDPYALYRRLRALSPAPFACYLNAGDWQIASSSPERFLRLEGRRVETRPIKGTRPRGRNEEEDHRLRDELWRSDKDRAELLMIVDLERNDLGRVCEIGSVCVDELYRIETHPTVHHLVSTVSGELKRGLDVIDCVRAAFPGGSITGAPKISAQHAIAALEKGPRGVYTGSIGYLGFDGNADLNIAIRTIICREGRASYQVGGGIVWDSDPAREYEETLTKGLAMQAALRGVELQTLREEIGGGDPSGLAGPGTCA